MRIVWAFGLAAMVSGVALAQERENPQDQIRQLQQALQLRVGQLGTCNSELGDFQLQFSKGQLVTWAQVKSVLQSANPGYTLGADFKLVPIPPEVKGK